MPLPQLTQDEQPDWQFFTEESTLRKALTGALAGQHLPEEFPLALLDDKWAFAEFLQEDAKGPPPIPQWSLDAAMSARYPLLLKARHSWVGGRKLPRGWVCQNAGELKLRREQLARDGLDEAWFFLQQWLGDAPMRLLSVAGFFDAKAPERNIAAVTERLTAYGKGPSSSAMLATIDDNMGLVSLSERVLARIQYRGPYELEFVATEGMARVLELNPRFWMQHGLFLLADNGLVKRYLNLDDATAERRRVLASGMLWADGFWLLRQIAGGNLAVWRRLRTAQKMDRAVICPSLGAAMRALVWRTLGGR